MKVGAIQMFGYRRSTVRPYSAQWLAALANFLPSAPIAVRPNMRSGQQSLHYDSLYDRDHISKGALAWRTSDVCIQALGVTGEGEGGDDRPSVQHERRKEGCCCCVTDDAAAAAAWADRSITQSSVSASAASAAAAAAAAAGDDDDDEDDNDDDLSLYINRQPGTRVYKLAPLVNSLN